MNDLMRMGVRQGIADFPSDPEGIRQRQLSFSGNSVAERFAIDEWHHVEEEAAGLARVVKLKDVRVMETRGDPDLAEKAVRADGGGEVRAEDLDRNGAVVPPIVREIDGRHPTATKLALDMVPLGQSRPDLGQHDRRSLEMKSLKAIGRGGFGLGARALLTIPVGILVGGPFRPGPNSAGRVSRWRTP